MKALAGVLAAKLCGKTAPADAAACSRSSACGAAPARPPRGDAAAPAPATRRPARAARAARHDADADRHAAPGKRRATNGLDDDGDGQTDWRGPGLRGRR